MTSKRNDKNVPIIKKEPVEFIIGVDDNGHAITHKTALKDVFYPALGISNHPIFVHFKPAVLDKYQRDSDTYTVWDLCLVRSGHWSLPMDNGNPDKVCVLLAYLRELPYVEQRHWQQYNILPKGSVSQAYYELYLEPIPFKDAEQPKHRFRAAYYELRARCYEYLGWQVLLQPAPDEEDYLRDLTMPVQDELRDFDAVVASLGTLCIDALNTEKLKTMLPVEQRAVLEGKDNLACLTAVLRYRGVKIGKYVAFLRELQRLRCGPAANRKSCNYRQIADAFGYDNRSLQTVFTGLLSQGIKLVRYLGCLVYSGDISNQTLEQRAENIRKGYAEAAARLDKLAHLDESVESERTDGSVNHEDVDWK